MYYKIILDEIVVDVVSAPSFVIFLPSGHISITDIGSSQGVIGSDQKTLYCFSDAAVSRPNVIYSAKVESIDIHEFRRLRNLLDSGAKPSADESALAEAKREALRRLSAICKSKITAGFSVVLSDGIKHSFKLTAEDQLNLMIIENQLNAGTESFVYHSTDMPCKIFGKEDMYKVVSLFKRHTLYHTTYFNAAKQYINKLSDIESVKFFTYGTDVSEIVEDAHIRQILKSGGNI